MEALNVIMIKTRDIYDIFVFHNQKNYAFKNYNIFIAEIPSTLNILSTNDCLK